MTTGSTIEEKESLNEVADNSHPSLNRAASVQSVLLVSEAEQDYETKESDYQVEDSDPFMEHVKSHFRGVLRKTKQLDKKTLEQYFDAFYQAVQQLAEAGKFRKIEEDLRTVFLAPLRNHMLDVMARELLNISDDRLYIPNLYSRVDKEIFSEVDDAQWQSILKLEKIIPISRSLSSFRQDSMVRAILQQNLSSSGDEVSTADANGPGSYFTFQQLLDSSQEGLERHGLLPMALQLLEAEQKFINDTLVSAPAEIQNIEKKIPGFYIDLLWVLSKHPDGYAAFNNIIDNDNLQQALENFLASDIHSLREELSKSLAGIINLCEQQRDDYRLQFYAQELAKREAQLLKEDIQEEEFYTSPDFIPENHDPENGVQYYPDSEAGLTNPYNLLAVTEDDEEGLDWLVHQYAEYELEVLDEVIEAIDFEAMDLDKDIASYILDSTFLDHEFDSREVIEGNFIPKVLKRLIEKIKNKVETPSEEFFPLPSLLQLVECIKAEFIRLAYNEEKILELRERFNDAWGRKDWPEVQKLWPVFTKFQRLLASTEQIRETAKKYPKARPNKAGRDHDLKHSPPGNYEELLNKAWEDYGNQAQAHYMRLYLSPDVHTITYSSRNPRKTAGLDLTPILGELEVLGRAIRNELYSTETSGNNKANILTSALCFVVTSKPHQKGGEHQRIFVPVNLDLLIEEHPYLLSNDYEEGVFTAQDENKRREYLKERAISDCDSGFQMLGMQPPENLENTDYKKLDHSERVLIEILRKPESNQKLVELLKAALTQRLAQLGVQFEEEGQYKVYAVALLSYSSNSICNYCTPSLISLQGSHNEGFLYELSKALNAEGSHFKTAGYNHESHTQSPEKLPMLTIITSDSPWSEQAYHLSEATGLPQDAKPPKQHQHMENPKGVIYLPNNEIDLHSLGIDLNGKSYLYHRTLVEFVRAGFSERHSYASNQPPFLYTGNSFMSGSKREKFGDNASSLDAKVKEAMQRHSNGWEMSLKDKKPPSLASRA